ncbi:MAG: hypothetical protein AAF368_07885 [Planctomycetota bacterium]
MEREPTSWRELNVYFFSSITYLVAVLVSFASNSLWKHGLGDFVGGLSALTPTVVVFVGPVVLSGALAFALLAPDSWSRTQRREVWWRGFVLLVLGVPWISLSSLWRPTLLSPFLGCAGCTIHLLAEIGKAYEGQRSQSGSPWCRLVGLLAVLLTMACAFCLFWLCVMAIQPGFLGALR